MSIYEPSIQSDYYRIYTCSLNSTFKTLGLNVLYGRKRIKNLAERNSGQTAKHKDKCITVRTHTNTISLVVIAQLSLPSSTMMTWN